MLHAIQIRQTGGPEVLNWTAVDVGEPGSGQVRLRQADAISFHQASAMMLQGMTAQVLIRQVYPVKAGDLILVHAAAGGTGLILCEWAAALGATVIGTVSTEAKAEMAHAHGCKHTILYSKQDFVAEVSRIGGGEKMTVVLDSVGRVTFLRSVDCLR